MKLGFKRTPLYINILYCIILDQNYLHLVLFKVCDKPEISKNVYAYGYLDCMNIYIRLK